MDLRRVKYPHEELHIPAMHRAGHFGISGLIAAGVIYLFGLQLGGLIAFGIVLTTLLPDMDLTIPGLSHRGYLHTFPVGGVSAVLVGGIVYLVVSNFKGLLQLFFPLLREPTVQFSPVYLSLAIGGGAFLGFCSHLLGDSLTVGSGHQAIHPFRPFSDRPLRFGLVESGNERVNMLLMYLGATALLLSINLYT